MSIDKPVPPASLPAYATDPIARQEVDRRETIRDYVDELLAYHRARETQPIEDDALAEEDEQLVDIEESSGSA